jgi:hypothetical protein
MLVTESPTTTDVKTQFGGETVVCDCIITVTTLSGTTNDVRLVHPPKRSTAKRD